MRTIGVVTTSRADYGLFVPIMEKIQKSSKLDLKLFVTGMHLSKEYGHTVDLIEKDGFAITAKVDMLLSDSPADIAKAMGKGTMGFAEVFAKNKPDILLVLGDRFEMHCAAVAAIPFGISISHIHGGELTYGSFDEYFRHSLTKMSQLHFTSTEIYANRIKQMGEESWRVIVSGAPGVDNIVKLKPYSQKELEKEYELDLSKPNLLTTFHPVTKEYERNEEYVANLLAVLAQLDGYNIVFTHPNADTNNHVIANRIKSFVDGHGNARMVDNFGQKGYLSMLKSASAMIGNSSSGIVEAASFKLPVVNIGDRQEGRVRAKNVIDVGYSPEEIKSGAQKALSDDFSRSLKDLVNPYGDGKASERIVATLESIDLEKLKNKQFHDYARI